MLRRSADSLGPPCRAWHLPPPGRDTGLHDTGHQHAGRRVSGIGRAGVDTGQWLLGILTARVGDRSCPSVRAAGVTVMGQAPNVYTFMAHLKWGWAIALGYPASVLAHLLINARFVTGG